MKNLLLVTTALFSMSCGQSQDSSELAARGGDIISDYQPGTFKLSEKAGDALGACKVFTELQLTHTDDARQVPLAKLDVKYHHAPNANCPTFLPAADYRDYELTVEKNGCGTVIMRGVNGENVIQIENL